MPTTHPRRTTALLATALAALLPGAAEARTSKPAGPALTIDAKACNTGTDAASRSIVLTASAVLRGTGDEVQMRFTVQQRAAIKTSWRTVFAKTGELGTWATSDAGADGLKYTKTINGLAEGTQYRVLIDARGIEAGGKVVTKTTRKSYTCLQPQLTPRLVLVRATPARAADTGPALRVAVRNTGRDASLPAVITVRDATTQATLGTVTTDAIPGRAQLVETLPLTSCNGQAIVSVQQQGEPLTALAPDQSLTITCGATATPARR